MTSQQQASPEATREPDKSLPQTEKASLVSSVKDTNSLAPLVANEQGEEGPADHQRRKSWFKKLISRDKKDENEGEKKDRKKSISDSGPYIFVFDPTLGKEVLRKNPHWPNEDSWKREQESEGQWAFGSMAGQQSKDFGGTVG